MKQMKCAESGEKVTFEGINPKTGREEVAKMYKSELIQGQNMTSKVAANAEI